MQISLTKDFFPFLRFATSPDVIGSAFQQEVNGFLQSLGSCFDWQEMVLVLDELLFKGEQEQDLFEIVNCFVNFVLELIRRFDDDFFEQVESLLQTLIQLADLLQQENEPTRAQRQLKAAMIELTHSVAQKSSRAEQVEKLAKALEDKAKAQKQEAKAKAAAAVKKKAFSIECYQVPPGRYRPGGPRHNNDSANIDSINVVPTEEEVLCEIPPYLPPNKAGTVAHLQKGSIEAHRDLHFRLLRHNLIADIKSVLLEFRKDGGIQGLRERDLQMPGLPLKVGPQDIQTDVYRNVQVIRMRAEFTSGVEFDNLKIIAQKSEYDKSAYWKKSSRLQSGTLACLCWESGVGRELNIVFGTIAERMLPNLCQNRPQIGLKSLLDSYHQKLENLMKPIRYNERRSEIILIQTGPCFYAYQPVLEALKRAPIPLSHYITQPPIERNPLINPLDAFRQPAPRMSCPQYFKRGGYFDLSFLCKNMASSSLKRVRENFFPLNDVVTHSTLDMSQAEALKTALTHELAIVQGPPGTGKTFLALQVMRALLSFTDDDDFGRSSYGQKSLAPILCVCFTNHALDQFLVGLLDAGITGVVRVGGNCKNERLEKFNLKNLEKPNLGKKGYQLRREILPELETKINAISHTEHDLYSVKAPEFSMMEELIRDASSSFFAAIVDSQDFRGEEKSLPLYQAWNKWWDQCPNRNRRTTRSLTTLLELEDIWDLSITEHRRLKTFWTEELRKNISEDSDSLVSRYEHSIQEYQKLQRESNLKCLKNATVIGMTTTYVAKNQQLLAGLKPKVVMLEEAAEVLEAHVLTCLCAQTEHVILIGDHLQLRPKVDQYIMQENSGSGLNLDISLFERLVTQNDIPFATLQTQRRMRPDFSQLIRPTVYPHLTDHESVRRYPSVPGVADNLYFIDHDHKELGAEEGKSHSNEFEAHYAVELAAYLSKHHIFTEEDIAIITPYVGQLLTIKRLLTSTSIPVLMNVRDEQLLSEMAEKDEDGFASGMFAQAFRSRRELNSCVRLATIDNFQGEEAKVIILSLVRNNKQGNIGFLGEKSRINVLLSRAKWGMYLIGNSESLVNCKKSNMWKEVINILKQQNRIGPCLTVHCPYHRHHVKKIAHWKDFRGLGTSGGCQLPCGEQLPCGHICRKCPSICGENCPSSTYCLIHGSASVKQMDVNLSGKRLCDLTDQNLINDPIIVLDCGHVFLTSFLDEVMSLKDFYAKDKRGMWTKPKLGEKFLNFEQRKVCPNCHAPIVNVRRYGRVINKTNLDLMERAFYQKCEERLSTLDKKVERAVITWNNSSQGATASTRSELSKKQSSVLEKIEREYTELLTYTQNPPSNEVHEMTKTRIASLLQDQSLSLEQIKQQMSVIAIPQTDPARQCKALISHGKCIKEFIYLQIEILKNLERIFPSSQQSAIKSDEMKKAVLDGQNKVTEILATITQSLDQAVQAKNNARIVDATQSALSICSVAFKFTIEAGHFNAANATDIPLSEIDQIVQNQASLIVDMAEKTFNAAVNACTSSSHRNTIRDSRFKLDQMKTALRKLKRSGRSSILESSPLFGYPEVQTSNFRDNISRCPKGHVFTTPYNTEMSSMPCCPDCGVQGQSTSLLSRLVSFIF
eukprot:g6793.t1